MLQRMQGIGVRPARYSSANRSTTSSRNCFRFMIEHVVGDPEPVGHGAGIADVVAGAAGALAAGGGAVNRKAAA
jgi:hypothetical protein